MFSKQLVSDGRCYCLRQQQTHQAGEAEQTHMKMVLYQGILIAALPQVQCQLQAESHLLFHKGSISLSHLSRIAEFGQVLSYLQIKKFSSIRALNTNKKPEV